MLCFSGMLFGSSAANAQCATCTPMLPTMPADTIYLDSFANAVKGQPYDEVASFRFPYTTTPLAAVQPGTPSGIALQSFTIIAVTGLPLGLTYTPDRMPMLYNESAPNTRDGCIRVCGTPQQSGTFIVNVSLMVATGIVAPQPANIPVTFIVEPDMSAGFSMDTSAGCAPLTVGFTNLIRTLGNETWTYNWNFGNGTGATVFAPPAVTYADSGQYTVSMQAISTLALPRTYLSSVTITAVGCTDPFGVVDLFLSISSPASGSDTVTPFVLNTAPPLIFNFGTDISLIGNTRYSIFVQDDDAIASGIPGPADCGTVTFNSDTLAANGNAVFNLTNGALTVRVRLTRDTLYQYDTVYTEDIVVVTDCDTLVSVNHYTIGDDISLKVYPNPTSGEVNLSFALTESSRADAHIRIYDALGRVVAQQVLPAGQSEYNEQLSLGQYGTGVYIVQMQVGTKMWHKKVIVQK